MYIRVCILNNVKFYNFIYFDTKLFNTVIPRNIRLGEAPSYGLPITMYDPFSKGARTYKKLAKELLDKYKGKKGE